MRPLLYSHTVAAWVRTGGRVHVLDAIQVAAELVHLVGLSVDDLPQDVGQLTIDRHAARLARDVVWVVCVAPLDRALDVGRRDLLG